MLKKFGYNLEVNLVKRGYYPSGNGLVEVSVKPGSAREINMVERGKIEKISGISHAHKLLEGRDVAGRQKKNARLLLFNELSSMNIDCEIKLDEEYCETLSVGSGLTLWAECENAVLGGSALGSKNKRAEEVGLEAGRMLLAALKSKAPVDVHMADQLIPYLALNGGTLLAPELSNHAKTNMHVVNQFGFNLKTEGNVIKS
jgi:RNA 3'-phosphate cyclase